MTLYPSEVWGQFVDGVYCNLKHTHLKIFFHHSNNLHQNIKFTIWNESNGELAFLDTLLIRNNGKTSVLVDTKPKHTHKYLHYSSKCPIAVSKKTEIFNKYKLFKISYLEFFFRKQYFGHTKFLYMSRRSGGLNQRFFF